jgi:hypothetical protein
MDNFFQILIYLVIIIAFLNSLFKKRDKDKTPPRPSNSPNPDNRNSYSSAGYERKGQQNSSDILKEIEGLFKGETSYTNEQKMEQDIEKAEMRKVPVEEHVEDKEWHTEDKQWHEENKEWHSEEKEWHSESAEWHEETLSDHQMDQSWHRITPFKRTVKVDKTIEKEAERFEQLLAQKQDEENSAWRDLSKNLFSSSSLKEYIVFSEILGKPKYLRR